MCTDGLRKAGVYEKYFELSAPGVELIYPDEEFQKLVTLGICNAKNSIRFEDPNANDNHPYNCILKVCNHLMETKGVDCIVVGCTDIRNIFEPPLYVLEKVKIVDSLEVLAESIIKDGKEFCR
jgi:aspartate/glutamate racemase